MPRVLIGSMRGKAREHFLRRLIGEGHREDAVRADAARCWMSQAMRVVSTRVLPLPAPGQDQRGWCGSVTAASCSGLRLASSDIVRCEFLSKRDSTAAATRTSQGIRLRASKSGSTGRACIMRHPHTAKPPCKPSTTPRPSNAPSRSSSTQAFLAVEEPSGTGGRPKYYCLSMFPYPSGAAHGPRAQLHHRRRDRPLSAHAGLATCCSRWAGTRSACRPRTRPWPTACRRRNGPTTTSPT